jgi:prevent-host-death family protein
MYRSAQPEPRSITVSEARKAFSDVVNRVAYGNERITVARHGREIVAIVSTADLRRLEAIEAAEAIGKGSPRSRTEPRP